MFNNYQTTSNQNFNTNVFNTQSATPDIFKGASLYDLIHLSLNAPSPGGGSPKISQNYDNGSNYDQHHEKHLQLQNNEQNKMSNSSSLANANVLSSTNLLDFLQDAIKKNNIDIERSPAVDERLIDVQMLDRTHTTLENINQSMDDYEITPPHDGLNLGDRVAMQLKMEQNNLLNDRVIDSRNQNEQEMITTNEYFMSNQTAKNYQIQQPNITPTITANGLNGQINNAKDSIIQDNQYYNNNSGTMTPTQLQDMKNIDTISDAMSLDDQIREKLQEVRNEKQFANTQQSDHIVNSSSSNIKKSQQRTGVSKKITSTVGEQKQLQNQQSDTQTLSPRSIQRKNQDSNINTPKRTQQQQNVKQYLPKHYGNGGLSSPKTSKNKNDQLALLGQQSPKARVEHNFITNATAKAPRDRSQSAAKYNMNNNTNSSTSNRMRTSKSNMRSSTYKHIMTTEQHQVQTRGGQIDRNQVMTPTNNNLNTEESDRVRFEKLTSNRPKSTHQKTRIYKPVGTQKQQQQFNSNLDSGDFRKNYTSQKSNTDQTVVTRNSLINSQSHYQQHQQQSPQIINLNDSADNNPYPLNKQSNNTTLKGATTKGYVSKKQANQLKQYQSPGGLNNNNKNDKNDYTEITATNHAFYIKSDPSSIQNSVSSSQASSIQNLDKHLQLKNPQSLRKPNKTPTRKQMMLQCISKFSIGAINEFNRIKKPQKYAMIIGKLICILVCTFRNPPLSEDYTYDMVQQEFERWESIQYFLLSNPNRTFNEIQQIKQRALQKSQVNLNFAKNLIKSIAENEQHLKNIPNQCLKQVFELITRTLIYVEYKHLKQKSPSKNSSQGASDTNLLRNDNLSNDGNNNQNPLQTEEDEENDNEDDQFEECLNEVQTNQVSQQQQVNQNAINRIPQEQQSIEQSLSEVTVPQETHFLDSSSYRTPDPNKYNLPLQKTSSNNQSSSKFMSPPRDAALTVDAQLKKLRQNYSNQNSAMREVKKSPNIKHKFISSSQPFQSSQSQSQSSPVKQQSSMQQQTNRHNKQIIVTSQNQTNQLQQPITREVLPVNLEESQQNQSQRTLDLNYSRNTQDQYNQKNAMNTDVVELKVDLHSEIGHSINTLQDDKKQSFIENRASEIIQELMTVQQIQNTNNMQQYQTPQGSKIQKDQNNNDNIYKQYNELSADEQIEFKAVESILEKQQKSNTSSIIVNNNHLSSAKHSRRSSMKIEQPIQALQQSDDEDQTPNSPPDDFSDISPKSPQSNKQSSLGSQKPKKKKKSVTSKQLSPTQKLIKFKNQSYKTKVKEQKQLVTSQQTNVTGGSSTQKNITSNKKPTFDYPLQEQKRSMQSIQMLAKSDKNQTPHSVTSTQRFDDLQYQIQMSNKDIFNIEDNTSNSDGTYRDNITTSKPNSRINVYDISSNSNNNNYQQTISIDDDFQLKLLKVDDPTTKVSYQQIPNTYQYQHPTSQNTLTSGSGHNVTFQNPSTFEGSQINAINNRPHQNESFISSQSSNKREINMNLIEELKQRRLNQMREREMQTAGNGNGNGNSTGSNNGQASLIDSQVLAQKRDEMIRKIQDEIADKLVQKIKSEEGQQHQYRM